MDTISVTVIMFAPAAGSLLGVLIRRIPTGRPVMFARSCCESCERSLSAIDLVPVASYLALGGRCRVCAASISPFHLAVELIAFGIAIWAVAVEPDPLVLLPNCLLGWTLLALAWIDVQTMRLPDVLTLPLAVAGLVIEGLHFPQNISAHVAGAILGYVAFKTVAIGYKAVRGYDGLGGGDAKLLAVAGAWLGWFALPDVVLLAAVLGIAASVLLRLSGRVITLNTALPFGPCLAFALWIERLHGGIFFDSTDGISLLHRTLGLLV